MNSESVDLIATDPPFNKGRDFHATPDSLAAGAKFQDRWSWERDVHPEWLDTIKDDWPAVWEVIDAANAVYMRPTKKNLLRPRDDVGSDMGAFLCFMAVRIMEMRRVLKPTGSIYLHCDHTASHYLKAIMDAVFGRPNFVNEIVWHYRKWTAGKFTFQRNHDVLLFYSRSTTRDRTFNQLFMPRAASTLKRFGEGKIVSGHDSTGRRIPSTVSGKSEGVRQDDVWNIGRVPPIKQLFPTQKPVKLYRRIVQASSNEGDMVLDPFAGCATTLVAAEQLDRQWLGIDIWDGAHKLVVNRLRNEVRLFGDVHLVKELPERTDDGLPAAPYFRTPRKVQRLPEPADKFKTREQKLDYLLSVHGCVCAGCDRKFDDPRYLDLDHNTPRSDGGMNHTSNRILLCGPCNRLKSNVYTLSGLRKENKRRGYMAGSESAKLREIREQRERNPGLFD